MSKEKKLRLVMQWCIEHDDGSEAHKSKSEAGAMYILKHESIFLFDGEKLTPKRVEKEIEQHMRTLNKKAIMSFANGWVLDPETDEKELMCIYCDNKTKGFDRGVANEHNKKFHPYKDPCPCRL